VPGNIEDLEKVGVHQFSDRGAHGQTSYYVKREFVPMEDCGGICLLTLRDLSCNVTVK
jgi:hypothetical protein